MTRKMCLVCGVVSTQSRYPLHRTNNARGYGTEHRKSRAEAIKKAPFCWKCGCPITTCKLEWHHVTELQGGRNLEKDDRRQLLCINCHNLLRGI